MKHLFSWGISLALIVAGCAPHPAAETTYTYPLTSPGAMFAALPPQVQNAVRAEAGSAEITNVIRLDLARGPVYQISFLDPKEYPILYVAQDGSVLDTNLTVAVGAARGPGGTATSTAASGLATRDLPPAVLNAVQESAPLATIAHISKETWGERVVYIISFTDPANHPKIYVASDGTVLKDTHQ
jgi:hypothetical protein